MGLFGNNKDEAMAAAVEAANKGEAEETKKRQISPSRKMQGISAN